MNERANPFADLKISSTFSTKPRDAKPVEEQAIARIADDNNFPSRQATRAPKIEKRKPRIRRTGRDQQFTAKTTAETKNRIYKRADEKDVALGELLRLALDALDREDAARGVKPAPVSTTRA
jgi:hypothetical protein